MPEFASKVSKPKRLGFGRACTACRKRKHRCDAIEPQCSGCRSRGNTCEYPTRATNKGIVDAHEESFEHGPATVLEPHPNISPGQASSMRCYSSQLSPIARRRLSDSSVQEDNGRAAVGLDRASIPSPAATIAQLSNPGGYFGDSSAIKFVSVARNGEQDSLMGDDHGLSIPEDIATRYGSSPREDLQHFKLLPDRSEGNQFVDAYFCRVHLLYPFVHETSFRSHYEQTWIDQGPQDIAWLAVVNMVFAYGCEFCPCPQGVEPVRRASQFVERAKQIILYQVFKAASLHLSQALLLLCHYLQGALELNEAWNFFGLAIRSAMSIGLHINPPNRGTLTTIDREVRKRIWWGCFVLDRTLSMKFGRPPSIILADAFDVDLPAEVDDQYITDTIQFPRQPGGRSARITAFIQTIGLSRVIDNIISKLYLKSRKPDVSSGTSMAVQEDFHLLGNILLLDGQLQSWWNSVPDHLAKSSESSEGIDLIRQRNVLYIRYVQMRLLLLRPSILLLGKENFQDHFLHAVATECAKRCVSAAQETIQLVHQNYHQQQLHSVWYILHYIFSSLGVLIAAQRLGVLASWDSSNRPASTILDEGMEFLRSASQQSSIAHRYVLLLGRHRDQLDDNHNSNNNTVRRLGAHSRDVPEPDLLAQGDLLHSGIHPRNGLTSFDPASINLLNPNDFLFGMGIPQDFLEKDWLTYDVWAT